MDCKLVSTYHFDLDFQTVPHAWKHLKYCFGYHAVNPPHVCCIGRDEFCAFLGLSDPRILKNVILRVKEQKHIFYHQLWREAVWCTQDKLFHRIFGSFKAIFVWSSASTCACDGEQLMIESGGGVSQIGGLSIDETYHPSNQPSNLVRVCFQWQGSQTHTHT